MRATSQYGLTLVTGAAGGIGSAVARRLATDGAQLALIYRSTRPTELITEIGGRVVFADAWDLSNSEAVATGVAALAKAAGPVKTVVHAAGPHVPMVHLSKVSPAQFCDQMRQDVDAFFNLTHAMLPTLRQTQGSITVVTTAATTRYPIRDGLSSTPKGAVEALSKALAAEEGRFGVRVNCVGPGMLVDGMAARLMVSGDLDERALDAARANIPLRRFGKAADIAEAVAFLASEAAGFVTGQKLDVDGGYGV